MDATIDATVIMATRNRAEILRETLDRLASQDAGEFEWELLVVDNGSTDTTRQVLQEFRERLPLAPLYQERPGQNAALNMAIDAARGELLIFTDDDIVFSEKWLIELISAAPRSPADGIFGGPIEPLFPEGTPQWLRDSRVVRFGRYRPAEVEGPVDKHPYGANFVLRASLIGNRRFNEYFGPKAGSCVDGGETELLWRLRDAGNRFIYVPSAGVEHVIPPEAITAKAIFRWAYRKGRGMARLTPDNAAPRLFGAPRFLWPRLIRRRIKHWLAWIRSRRAWIESGAALNYARGAIHEYRVMARESDASTKAPVRRDEESSAAHVA